ncbi:MAG: hypothetical protein QOJ01_1270 [Solirubrobacterales bacterium]|nr:hypothetical protein [Solirubrobacterales bacterium]
MNASRHARLGALTAVLLALLPAALALWIHDRHAPSPLAAVPAAAAAPRASAPAASTAKHLGGRAIAKEVERIRGMRFEHVPPIKVIGPGHVRHMQSHLVAKLTRRLAKKGKSLSSVRRRSDAGVEFAKLAGVVSPEFDAVQSAKDLVGSVAGEFKPGSRKVEVLATPGEGAVQVQTVIAHELDHALDNSRFPEVFRAQQGSRNDERVLALKALVEGTATVVAARFDARHGYQAAVAGGQLLSADNAGYGVPPALAAQFRFPYTSGVKFVQALYARGRGWRLVNAAFRRPPTTTAEILDPQRWIHHSRFAKVRVGDSMPAPWRLVQQTVSGQLDAELILALALPANVATAASRGWDGGGIAVWKRPGANSSCAPPCRQANAAVVADRWTSIANAARFTAELPTYLENRLGANRTGTASWRVGDGFAAIALSGQGTALTFAPAPTVAVRIAQRAAREADGAR